MKRERGLSQVCWGRGCGLVDGVCSSGAFPSCPPLRQLYKLITSFIRHSREDSSGVSLRTELEKHGFLGETPSSFASIPLSAHFEVHIEQGPMLCNENDGAPVGLVKGVQGFKWFEIELKGRTQHAATRESGCFASLALFALSLQY